MAAIAARKRSTPSSWNEESSSTTASTAAPERTCWQSGVPRFPPVKVGRWAASSAPVRAVVVDLPLVPVMPTTGDPGRQEAPAQLHLSPDRDPAAPRGLELGQRPWARRARPPPGRPARSRRDRGRPAPGAPPRPGARRAASPSAASSCSGVRRSVTVTRAPSRRQSRAAERPLRASPTTVTFFPESARARGRTRAGYLSLMESSATRASIMERIQKRTMILGSAQPLSS